MADVVRRLHASEGWADMAIDSLMLAGSVTNPPSSRGKIPPSISTNVDRASSDRALCRSSCKFRILSGDLAAVLHTQDRLTWPSR